MRLDILIPQLAGLVVKQVVLAENSITLTATARDPTARCPCCHQWSARVQSRYWRTIADVPFGRRPVRLHLQVRRFRCTNETCPRRIFAEQFPGLVARHARRTLAQSHMLEDIALAVGGQAGVRLAAALGAPTSRNTLLRLLRALPAATPQTPRVLGVDDWSLRRGRTYGTILVDLEARRPIDLLPDRTADTLARWLREHPGVEIIARDRAGAYAEGARQGAPQATQVADRFHLLMNLGDAFERVLSRHAADLRAAAKAVAEANEATSQAVARAEPAAPRPPTRPEREAAAGRVRRQARYDEIRALAQRGYSTRAIARHLQLHRATVTKYLRAESCPHPGPRPNRRSLVDPWVPYLQERWAAGCRNAQELFREIQALGFPGGRSIVSARLAAWRTGPRRPGPYPVAGPAPADTLLPALPAVKHWSPRRTRGLLLKNEGDLTDDQRAYRSQLLTRCPAIGKARELVHEFRHLVKERDQAALGPWLANARSSGLAELREFAAGIERDRAAVEAALRLDISNGQTEGQITKLKLLKRAAYGRASLTLLRARLLRAG